MRVLLKEIISKTIPRALLNILCVFQYKISQHSIFLDNNIQSKEGNETRKHLPVAVFGDRLFTSFNFKATCDPEVPQKVLGAEPAASFM